MRYEVEIILKKLCQRVKIIKTSQNNVTKRQNYAIKSCEIKSKLQEKGQNVSLFVWNYEIKISNCGIKSHHHSSRKSFKLFTSCSFMNETRHFCFPTLEFYWKMLQSRFWEGNTKPGKVRFWPGWQFLQKKNKDTNFWLDLRDWSMWEQLSTSLKIN